MAKGFVERLEQGPIVVADGGMGTLISGAVPRLRCPEEANLRSPETVISLHVSFINAGADLIETNTFGANRRKLAGNFLEDEVENINSAAVKLAREAREISGRDVYIAGSIGPLGELSDLSTDYRRRIFTEQARALHARGVDLFVVETFYELDELLVALESVREVSSLPVVAMLTFDEQGETLGGVTAKEAVEALADSNLAAIGANHGAGIHAALTALNEMHETDGDLALAAMPNMGLASLAGNKLVFPHATPEYFSDFAAHARNLGARIIGGCCGTTPLEIGAIAAAVTEEREARSPLVIQEREVQLSVVEVPEETQLARMLADEEWVVSVQLDPPLGGNHRGMLDVARGLRDGRLDAGGHQRQRDRPGGDERADALGGDRADDRARDDPAPDHQRRVRARARVAAPGRARRRDPQRPRRHGRPARGRRLPGLARRLRDRLDRARPADGASQPRRGLQRPLDRRGDVVPHRRRGEPVRRRPRPRARALPAQDRRRRALRDDPDRLRPRVPRPLLRPARRRVADPGARRNLPGLEPRARAPASQRGARDHRPRPGAGGPAARPVRTARASGWRSRRS